MCSRKNLSTHTEKYLRRYCLSGVERPTCCTSVLPFAELNKPVVVKVVVKHPTTVSIVKIRNLRNVDFLRFLTIAEAGFEPTTFGL